MLGPVWADGQFWQRIGPGARLCAGPDGKCDDIPYHQGPIPAAACVKSWTVVESLGAVFVWHDPEGGEPEWEHPSLPQWDNPAWVRPKWDHLGIVNQHPQELVDNICDYAICAVASFMLDFCFGYLTV